ncbi:hypothetical protein HWI79_2577 [Cryptosporidium felis]|nr:hypothetical protein HWI79_2577 [Cryptosporidium felis]
MWKKLRVKSILQFEHPADCIYVNSSDNRHFGVGLYSLEDPKTQKRVGGVDIYDTLSILGLDEEEPGYEHALDSDSGSSGSAGTQRGPKVRIDAGSGVVNFEWEHGGQFQGSIGFDSTQIICLCSDKSLKLFGIASNFESYSLMNTVRSPTIEENNQVIGLDLTSVRVDGTRKTCFSISDGRVFFVRDLEFIEHEFSAHSNTEVWTVAFLDDQGNVLGTGADDCVLSIWDLRMDCSEGPANINRKSHSMGVTCIQKSPKSQLFWTGSYDETLRLWDSRMVNSPVYQHKVQGGIWRINPFEDLLGLAQCYFGFEYFKLDSNLGIHRQVISHPNSPSCEISHKSIVYGIDTFRIGKSLFGLTCSFYDKTSLAFQILED